MNKPEHHTQTDAMLTNIRFWQVVQLSAGVVLITLCWYSRDIVLGILGTILASIAFAALLTPTPQQKIESQIQHLQLQGIYPQSQPTDEDVQRLLKAGYKLLAIRLYREVHNVPLKQAVAAIKQLS